jgi:hypothetical protein
MRVTELRQAVSDGRYEVDVVAVAEALLRRTDLGAFPVVVPPVIRPRARDHGAGEDPKRRRR